MALKLVHVWTWGIALVLDVFKWWQMLLHTLALSGLNAPCCWLGVGILSGWFEWTLHLLWAAHGAFLHYCSLQWQLQAFWEPGTKLSKENTYFVSLGCKNLWKMNPRFSGDQTNKCSFQKSKKREKRKKKGEKKKEKALCPRVSSSKPCPYLKRVPPVCFQVISIHIGWNITYPWKAP